MRTAPVLNRAAPRTPIATNSVCVLLLAFITVCCTAAHAELVIDGHLDEPEWQSAISLQGLATHLAVRA